MSRAPLPDELKAFLRGLGATVRDVRRERGLLQEQIGARAGVTGARIGEIERGIVNTSIARVAALAAALGLPLAALLRRYEVAHLDDRAVDAIRSRVVEMVRRLPVADLDLVAAIVARLVRS